MFRTQSHSVNTGTTTMKQVFFALVFVFFASPILAQEKPDWRKVNSSKDLKNWIKKTDTWRKHSHKTTSFYDVVSDIRNRPARHIPSTYREGRDYKGLSRNHGWRGGGWGGWGHGGWGWGGRYHHASTAAQGWLDGVANLVRAQGQRAESFTRAYTRMQEGHRRRILNDSFFIEQWFERRKMNREYRAAERPALPTPEQIKRWSKVGLPEPLSETQFNYQTGKINWPEVLMWDAFKIQREALDRLFELRCRSNNLQTGVGSTNYRWIKRIGENMIDVLNDHIKLMDAEEYIMTKNFMDSLLHEARSSK